MSHGVRRLDLFVTEACNLGCPYCFAATRPRKNPTLEDSVRAVDWLMQSESDKVHITLWGGEPLLRRELTEQVVAHARATATRAGKRVTFSMPTNASLLDAETMQWLEANDVKIFLSIDGDEKGQATRPLKSGASSHDLVALGMKRALSAPLPKTPAVRMTVTPDNAEHQASGARYFLDNGADQLMIYAAFDLAWSERDLAAFERGQRELATLFVEQMRAQPDPKAVPDFKAWRPILRRLLDGVPARRREGPLRHCGAGKELVALSVEGEFSPCHRFIFYSRRDEDDVSVGDIEHGIDAERAARFSSVRIEDMQGVARCNECEIFDLCTYGCLAISYVTTGALDRVPESACRLMDIQVEVCREVHAELRDDPRYALYLGRTLESTLKHTADGLAARASQLYRTRTSAGA